MPTFLLKGVDPNKILADYQAGVYSRPSTLKSKIHIAQNTCILAPTYGTSNQDPIFSVRDRNNCSVIIATTGHSDFEVFTRTGGDLPTGGRCEHCRDEFDHTVIGYPIGYQEQTILTNDSTDPRDAHYRVLYVFWVEGRFCSFECALGYLRLMLGRPADYRDTTLRDSERMLKHLHKLTYPTAGPLRPAQDPRLLRSNGGSLSREEWQDQRHIFVRTDRILMIPAKVEYVQQNFMNPAMAVEMLRDVATAVVSS
jgi:hypothetical protein